MRIVFGVLFDMFFSHMDYDDFISIFGTASCLLGSSQMLVQKLTTIVSLLAAIFNCFNVCCFFLSTVVGC